MTAKFAMAKSEPANACSQSRLASNISTAQTWAIRYCSRKCGGNDHNQPSLSKADRNVKIQERYRPILSQHSVTEPTVRRVEPIAASFSRFLTRRSQSVSLLLFLILQFLFFLYCLGDSHQMPRLPFGFRLLYLIGVMMPDKAPFFNATSQ